MTGTPTPFTLHVDQAAIDDLRQRLALTRLPDQPAHLAGDSWAYGADLGYMRDLIAYWRDGFDWRAEEAALNAFPQYRVEIDGIPVHYLRVEGKGAPGGPAPMPLLLLHGWPGSVFEFLDILPRLTDPARFGGDPADALTVIAPSLPGFGLSFAPGQRRLGAEAMADILASLMTDVLGYRRFAAQGGDWGSFVASRLAYAYPQRLIGIHLNLMPLRRDPNAIADPTPEEARYFAELTEWLKEETGYQWIQGTRPQTLAFALTDSPAGLAAWIAEKFHAWTDCDGVIENAVSRDRMLADIALYWFTGAIGSSFWPYYARMHGPWPVPEGKTVDVPTGYCQFPREILRPPQSLARKTYTNIRQWNVLPMGGHFAALEQPAALAADIQAFHRLLRNA